MYKSRDKNPFSVLALLRCRTNVFAKRYRNRRKATIDFNDDPENSNLPASSFDNRETVSNVKEIVATKGKSSRSMLSRDDMANMSYILHISERLMNENDVEDRDTWDWSMSGMSSIQREFHTPEKVGSLPLLTPSTSFEFESASDPEADPEANTAEDANSRVKCPMKSDGAICESVSHEHDAETIQDEYDDDDDDMISVSDVSTITALSFMTSYTSMTPESKYMALKMKKRALERQIEQNLYRFSNLRIPSSIQVKTPPKINSLVGSREMEHRMEM